MELRPLNVCTLSTLFPHAAAPDFGVFVERQTAALARQSGVDVTVVNPLGLPLRPIDRMDRVVRHGLPELENWNGLTVHRPRFRLLPKLSGSINPALMARAITPLVRRLHAARPFDLIDAEFAYPDGPAAMRIARAIGVPFSIKARGADIHYWGARRSSGRQLREAADEAAGLLAVSRALADDMIALGLPRDKIRVHYTGVDQERFRPVDRAAAKRALDIAGPMFVTVGALIERKNQALVIRAMPRFPDATLCLAGAGPDEFALRNLAKELGVADRVRFLGPVPHDELPAIVGAADIAILVSQSEGLANAWVEALACGTPVIISEAGGARELVTSDVAGRVIDPTIDALERAVADILADPPDPQAVRAAVARFSWDRNGEELAACFRELV